MIYRPSSSVEADLLRSILHERGIESTIENDTTSQWNYRSVTAPLTITVADSDESRATEILQEHFDRLKNQGAGPKGSFERGVASGRKARAQLLIAFYSIVSSAAFGLMTFASGWGLRASLMMSLAILATALSVVCWRAWRVARRP